MKSEGLFRWKQRHYRTRWALAVDGEYKWVGLNNEWDFPRISRVFPLGASEEKVFTFSLPLEFMQGVKKCELKQWRTS